MKKWMIILVVLFSLSFATCELLEESTGLTTEEVVEGLKTALIVGTDTSVALTSTEDGYFRDEAIKILLPEDAQTVYDMKDNSLIQALGISDLMENMVLSLNRAAEDAANEAKPIFKESITSLTISDGWDILNGVKPAGTKNATSEFDSTAATNYLRSITFGQLKSAFSPKIDNSLDKPLISIGSSDYSTNSIWTGVTNPYNDLAESIVGQLAGLETIDSDLSDYVTEKALDGLFKKVGDEEVKIRRDPWAWATTAVGDIFERVFGGN